MTDGTRDTSKDSEWDFHLEEWKALRAEIVEQGKKYDQLKITMMGGLAFYYGWAISHVLDYRGYECINHSLIVSIIIFSMPIAVCHIAKANARYFSFYFDVIGNYVRSLERLLGKPELGWQGAWFRSLNRTEPVEVGKSFGDFYWKAIIVFVYAIPVLLFFTLLLEFSPNSSSQNIVNFSRIDKIQCPFPK